MTCCKRLPGSLLALLCSLLLVAALPNIQGQAKLTAVGGGANYVQQLDKSFFQPPEIEQTIDEVQKILARDPALPRLTRGEIEELYEKVTREEYEKSIEAGDLSRADSMRALMLVLPFNTDNNTEENLQELYTRPPVTRVIDAYTPPNPIKFLTADPSAPPRSTVPGGNPAVAATTYKPSYNAAVRQQLQPTATTYHPPAPAPVMYQLAPALGMPSMQFQPLPQVQAPTQTQRYSSHYNAKQVEFRRKPQPSSSSSTVKPVADILESLGIGAAQSVASNHKRYAGEDYYAAESAPQPQVVAMADLRGMQGARIRPDAYANFKPLNIGEELRVKPEVAGYLTRFGIVKKAPKSLQKTQAATPTVEPTGAHTELSTATAKLPELAKLLQNLQELERLQSSKSSSSTTTTTSTTSTTTTPTPPTTLATLITHGAPMLIEAKKPRRRIDPHIDLNFGSQGNQQRTASGQDELAKLLQNLQELERLQFKPPSVSSSSTTAKPLEQLLLQQLQQQQQQPKPKPKPKPVKQQSLQLETPELLQLQRLLSDDSQLERLYEQARASKSSTARPSTSSSTTTTTTTTTPRTSSSSAAPTVNPLQFAALMTRVQQLEQQQQPSKQQQQLQNRQQHLERSNQLLLPDVQPHDYVQLQKLLSKVQELERVQLQSIATTATTTAAPARQLTSAASQRTHNVKSLSGTQIVYAQQPAEELELEQLKLQLPVYRQPASSTSKPLLSSSSEELQQYQQFFQGLQDAGERQLQPIYKSSKPTTTVKPKLKHRQSLAELQKLLYNTAQLQQLGVALPTELSQQLETQLQMSSTPTTSSSTTTTTTTSTTTTSAPATTALPIVSSTPIHDSSSPAVFSLTTSKPATPRFTPTRVSTASSLDLPVYSATKIIEAAIKRAANRIGVPTEQAPSLGQGFRRRSVQLEQQQAADEQQQQVGVLNGDLMAEFSELNYQLAQPAATPAPAAELSGNLSELQRLISNLQQLQQLNVSLTTGASTPDALYLQSQLAQATQSNKPRRQSANSTSSSTTTTSTTSTTTTTEQPERLSLNVSLDDTLDSSSPSSSTTEESRNGSLDDLADSFAPDPVAQEPPPAKKKNGFYFLADWNSFLEVGDGDDQVVVRLSPKIGDPRDFLPV
ncbi:CG11409 [Drosophila busckii]|uniref:CG11409 n=1 Tax=Drosophila busckii TaxID=30019 RepID=A0A0M4EQN9_DROBS|nr:mucin-5AC [Drosophila busckii]ALC48277.1 CG11409 [Drosophila busckii]